MLSTEYTTGTTHPRACYHTMSGYKHMGFKPIVPPTPATVQPELFNMIQPRPYKPGTSDMRFNCGGYKTLGETCSGSCWT